MPEKTPDELFQELYADLRKLAGWFMAGERDGHTLQPSALINEAWIKVFSGKTALNEADRGEIIGAMSRAMRNVLIDYSRQRNAKKRGGEFRRVSLDDVLDRCVTDGLDVVELKEALDSLEPTHALAASAFTLRFIAGAKVSEIALVLGKSESTIHGQIKLARALLFARLVGGR